MPKKSPEMQSWQIFHFARKHLNRSVLYAIFGKKNARAVDYWCEDPRYTAKLEGAYDPIQGVKSLLNILDDHGHCGIVKSAIAYLSDGTSAASNDKQEIVEPLSNISEEILADFRAVSELQRAIEAKLDIAGVEHLLLEAIAELERTVACYQKEALKSEQDERRNS
jgi:hypothetical protein